jgi:phenylpyruvate C(3)-methyltransferase
MVSDRLFNSVVAGSAIAAAFDLGLFAAVKQGEVASLEAYCRDGSLHLPTVRQIVRAMAVEDIVVEDSAGGVRPGTNFDEVYASKGYFMWLVQGYGTMLSQLSSLARSMPDREGAIERDDHYVALSGEDYGRHFVDEPFNRVLSDCEFSVAADLGCGSGRRLAAVLGDRPSVRGVGVDRSPDAVGIATETIKTAGLDDRVQVRLGDAFNLDPDPVLEEVDLVWSFFMGHDLWPRERCVASLERLRKSCPSVKTFLMCDTYRADVASMSDMPIFSMGFELTHAVMGQYIPSPAEWEGVFEDAGWRCEGRYPIGIPNSEVFWLTPAPGR